jgi:N-acetylglutamate synthase and related acetyltransferases
VTIGLFSAADRPDLVGPAEAMGGNVWPPYLSTPTYVKYWQDLYKGGLARFQTIAIDSKTGAIAALGNCVPFPWVEDLPQEGWDWVLETGVIAARNGTVCDAVSALSVAVHADYRSSGLAQRMLEAMKSAARAAGIGIMVAPVRPTRKHLYPLHDFETYCGWRREDGTPFDPWLRTHTQMGATFLKPALRSMSVTGTLEQWQRWTELRFPRSGTYWLPRGLAPLEVDLESGLGLYTEPNYWLRHPLD